MTSALPESHNGRSTSSWMIAAKSEVWWVSPTVFQAGMLAQIAEAVVVDASWSAPKTRDVAVDVTSLKMPEMLDT